MLIASDYGIYVENPGNDISVQSCNFFLDLEILLFEKLIIKLHLIC